MKIQDCEANIESQLCEVELLQSMYPGEDEFKLNDILMLEDLTEWLRLDKTRSQWVSFHDFCFALKHQAFISLVAKVIFRRSQLMIWPQNWSNYEEHSKEKDQFWCQIINCLMRNIIFTTHEMNAWCFEAKQKSYKASTVCIKQHEILHNALYSDLSNKRIVTAIVLGSNFLAIHAY